MLILISPAKSLDFAAKEKVNTSTEPVFQEEANKLIKKLKTFSTGEIQKLMNISTDLAELNINRYHQWQEEPNQENTKQALVAFNGEVYRGINTDKLRIKDFQYSQKHLRILSGLYGLLRPLDRIQRYRLEMGTTLKYNSKKNLYKFWDSKITDQINNDLGKNKYIVNLASKEYFKSVKKSELKVPVITPVFKDFNKGKLKIISVYAKNARGQMVNFILRNRITDSEDLKHFDVNGYGYDDNLSDEKTLVFTR